MGLFTPNNNTILIILVLFCVIVFPAVYIIRHEKEKLENILIKSIIIFLVLYFPLLDYWSIWIKFSFWPSDFYHASGSILSSTDEIQYGYYPKTLIIFKTLTYITELLFYFILILFVYNINLKFKIKHSFINYIPLLNIFSICFYIDKNIKLKSINKLLLFSWVLLSFLSIYYKIFAGLLFLIGFDSISILDQILFSSFNKSEFVENDYDIGYTFLSDILNIVTPVFVFISGILSLALLKMIRKTTKTKVFQT